MNSYIVLHTHWDREWYFTTSDSLVLMDRTFKNIINELQLYPELSFCLDGQYSIIDEFLSINPQLEAVVKKLVQAGRLQIGPWHTQTDTQLVAEESIVRNLYYGMNKTQSRFGKVMEVGYLPDTFGFCHQLPEVYNLAGIDKAIFWRGADFSDGTKPYFNWQGAGGSVAKTLIFYGGYGMAKGFSAESDFVHQTLEAIIDNYKQLGIDGEIVIPVGNDQFEIKADVPQTIKTIKKQYDLDLKVTDYGTSIENIFKHNNFDTYTREFRKTAYTRLHKSIGSVRYDLKQENYEAEQLLINEVEPLFVIAKQFNIFPSVELLYKAWALLFEGHAHDGICGCVSDAVYDDMKNRIKRAKEIGNSLKNLILKQIASALKVKNSDILLVNTSPRVQNLYEVTVYSDQRTAGIKGYNSQLIKTQVIEARDDALVETPTGSEYERLNEMYIHELVIECELQPYEIKVISMEGASLAPKPSLPQDIITNGLVTVEQVEQRIDVQINGFKYKDAIKIIDVGNDGDTYDFSPVLNDNPIPYTIKSSTILSNGLKKQMIVDVQAYIPNALEDRLESTNLVLTELKIEISIYDGDDKVYVKLIGDNQTLSHKTIVRINAGENIKKTLSSSAYGKIEREVKLDEEIIDWEQTNVEKPVSIETFDGFVKASNGSMLILSSFGKEYQAHNQGIDLTVFATTGELGKSNLQHRPGRASGDVTKKGHILIDTPKAQCLGKFEFEFALTTGTNDYFESMDKVQAYRTNAVSYQVQDINKFEGRIDNKLMDYRNSDDKFNYVPLTIETNGYITSLGIGLDGETIVRGVANQNHYLESSQPTKSINLMGQARNERLSKFQIFNYQIID